MKLSDFLRWAPKKAESTADAPVSAKKLRQALRGSSGWIHWASDAGEGQRARISFLDGSEDPNGLRLRASKAPPNAGLCWIVPDAGRAFPCNVRQAERLDEGWVVDASLDLQSQAVTGLAGSRIQWVDEDRTVHTMPATVKNSGQGLIEVNVPANIPARRMVYLEGRQYGCLAICRGARPDGSRFILVVEAASDSFATTAAAA